jgi:hypothetical protein
VKNNGSMEKRPRGWKSDLEVHVEGGKNEFGILRDWHERKDADLIASSSDGKTDRPASRYVNFFNRSNERRENRK